ncbi:gamma-glutamyl-gamma-aminobutyrate hydrolase family protein [Bacillus sp. FJAT-49736]|uniref:gamma-glutamyl-gamma-aminobutyrate hydrolase family protein n=1 Tax=Bacillus sp. FJAT-49736 TaxID=2833582 RepID=UPI001BCA6467|nr:gamma-glutamyl-gamma-aminobutyrate hydrolase family protein [Bacillus sp. FJAT-49736]MBS4174683.1 gamma-glutamyl-gamma-aminobutyrate hydrolase family protein [Bacillus sp. FJAT-49736]
MLNIQKPIIGITSTSVNYNGYESSMLPISYCEAITNAGGIPVIIAVSKEEMAAQWLNVCDGIILSGGEDMDPSSYHEEPHPKLKKTILARDQFEVGLVQAARKQKIPILAICRGVHIMNVAMDGTIMQDIESIVPNCIQHTQKASSKTPSHSIKINENSLLFSILGLHEARVNSFHHQAVNNVAPGLKVTARANDGIIEAIEAMNMENGWMLGVQWHPEEMGMDYQMDRLFSEFIKVCELGE